MLQPENLQRFSAVWIAPAGDVSDVVDTYWAVSWNLDPGESIEQSIIDFPAITLSIEELGGERGFVATSIRSKAWKRTIGGRGVVFGIRLRPAGLAVVSDLEAVELPPELTILPGRDGRSFEYLRDVEAATGPEARAERSDERVRVLMRERRLRSTQLLANAAVRQVEERPSLGVQEWPTLWERRRVRCSGCSGATWGGARMRLLGDCGYRRSCVG